MAEASALNSLVGRREMNDVNIKVELEAAVKPEPLECAVCAGRSPDCADMLSARTAAGTLLLHYLSKFTHCDLAAHSSRHVCKPCLDIIAVLEQAELEYFKVKETFEAIISKNPLFDNEMQQAIAPVKVERETYFARDSDSEDEPLAATKKRRRRVEKPKKKATVPALAKRRPRSSKKIADPVNFQNRRNKVTAENAAVQTNIKTEESVGTENILPNQILSSELKLEVDVFEDNDDDDSDFFPDNVSNGDQEELLPPSAQRQLKGAMQRGTKKRKEDKTVYQCDQCNAKYTSAKRLELHKEKHSEGKPPYICEVCGACYKHKRACDIHVALHKGISDWKCEECNKLFPSKGALQRHNNIHTGRLNYQCDLCGKSFIHTSSFKMHKLSHSGVKPHSCDVCGLALMTRSHLKRHKRIHSGEKRHECGVCGKRFSERYNLAAHSKSHEAAGGTVVESAPRRRLFRCTFCPERFERRYMLERHVSTAHGRTLERAPATPRNTMSKLLKAQAQARAQQSPGAAPPAPPAPPAAHPPPALTPASDITDTKEERSPDSRASAPAPAPAPAPHKLALSSVTTIMTSGSWSGAYAAEFGLRDYPH